MIDHIIAELKAGNERFLNNKTQLSSSSSLSKLKEFAKNGQVPKAVVLCCSDSRAPVEIIFDQDIGDLFVIRVAGNIVAPSLLGSIEFAVNEFGIKLVLVMGHTQCGAITATLNHIHSGALVDTANLHSIVSRIKPHIYPIARISDLSQEEQILRSVEANVIASVAQIPSSSRMLEEKVQKNELRIKGAVLNISTGKVDFLDI